MNRYNIITYTNWAKIDYEHKKGNKIPSLDVSFDDLYFAKDFEGVSADKSGVVMPFMTLFRDNDKRLIDTCTLNLKDGCYDYYFSGEATSGMVCKAIVKYMRTVHLTGEFILYLNSVSSSNLLFNGEVK